MLVAEFSGTGNQDTKEFTVKKGWEIRWETKAGTFQMAITGAQDFGKVVDHPGEGSGATFPIGAGTFQLHITADGPWMVRVTGFDAGQAASGLFLVNVSMLFTFWSWGLLNPWLQHWQLPNLWVLGGSAFPQNGSGNPTLTILALTLRAADGIVDRYLKSPGRLA